MTIVINSGDALTIALAFLITFISAIGAAHLAMQAMLETILSEIEQHREGLKSDEWTISPRPPK